MAALAAHFPTEYMGSLGQGQIGSGIITSLLDIVNVASLHNNKKSSPEDSAFYCFLMATLFLCMNIAVLLLMINTRYYKVNEVKVIIRLQLSYFRFEHMNIWKLFSCSIVWRMTVELNMIQE